MEECQSEDETAVDTKAGFNLNEDLDDALFQMSVNVLAKLRPTMPPQLADNGLNGLANGPQGS